MTTVNNKIIIASSMIASIGIFAITSTAQFVFDDAVQYGLALDPNGMTSGDFDGDGDLDLATATSGVGPDSVTVFLNAGDGTYGTAITSALPSNSNPRDLVAGDLDADGDIDLAVALRDDPNGAIRIMFNDGTGLFTLGPTLVAGDRPGGMSIADMDGDGDLDITAANRNSDTITIITNDGGGLFTATQISVGPAPRSTAFGDFVPGGNLEIAVTNHGNRTVSIMAGGASSLVEVMNLFVGAPIRPDGIAAADLNGDGLDDFVTATSHLNPQNPNDNADFATVFLNTGKGFSGPFNYDTEGTTSSEVIAVDLNCDGSLDLAISNTDSNDLSVLPNNGDGTFGASTRIHTGSGPSKATAGDFNSDGGIDLASANAITGDISVAINQTCSATPCPADITGDGIVSVSDLLELIATWGACNGCASDINNDGFVDVSDLLEIIGSWGVCP